VLTFGQANTTAQIFQLAIDRFDAVLAMSGANDTQKNMARVGKARALLNLGLSNAAAAAAVAAAVFSTVQLTGEPQPGPLVAMHEVLAVPISARVSVTPEAGGSKLWMTCHYRGQEPWDHPYALVVTDNGGARHRLATWRVGPDGKASVTASLGLPPSQIAAIELTTMDGQTLLRLRHPA
jgi:hypothetical protein